MITRAAPNPTVAGFVRAVALRDYAAAEEIRRKAAVAASTTGAADTSTLVGLEGVREYRAALERRLLPAALEDAWRVQFYQKAAIDTSGAAAYWLEPGGPIPVSAIAAEEVATTARTVGTLVVVSKELVRATGARADATLVRVLTGALSRAVNAKFLSADAAADGAPAGIAASATAVPTTGDDAADLAALVEAADAADVDLRSAAWIMSPARAAGIALSLGLPGLGLRGGILLGAPALTDPAAEDRVYLLDASRLAVSVGDPDVDTAEEASVELDDEPTNDGSTPTETTLVSLWQNNLVGFRATVAVDWTATDSVFVLGPDES